MWRDVVLGYRRLRARPLFALFAVLAVALGAGVPAAVYGAVRVLVWAPLDLPESEGFTAISVQRARASTWRQALSYSAYRQIDDAIGSKALVAASAPLRSTRSNAGSPDVVVRLEAVSGNYFAATAATADYGRLLSEDDDQRSLRVVLLCRRLAISLFGSARASIGQQVRIASVPFEVVGVATRRFDVLRLGHQLGTEAWVPISTQLRGSSARPTEAQTLVTVFLKVAEGEDATVANGLLGSLDLSPFSTGVDDPSAPVSLRATLVRDLLQQESGVTASFGLLFVILVSLILLVAVGSIANLMLSRLAQRRSELFLRQALGASNWRLLRLILGEAALIVLGGALLALGVAKVVVTLLATDLPIAPGGQLLEFRPELDAASMLGLTAALAAALLTFGLWPALVTLRRERRMHLQHEISKGQSARRATFDWPIRWQAAIAVIFCLVAWACVEAVTAGERHDSGMTINRIAVMHLRIARGGQLGRFDVRKVDSILASARRANGVDAVATAVGLPFGVNAPMVSLSVQGPSRSPSKVVQGLQVATTPGFFAATGVSILRGRGIGERDIANATSVIVVSQSAADELLGNRDPLGRLVEVTEAGSKNPETVTVVGIAGNTDVVRFLSRKGSVVYRPLAQMPAPSSMTLVALATTDVSGIITSMQTSIAQGHDDIVVEGFGSGQNMLAGVMVMLRLIGTLAAILGLVAVTIAMVGLYGVIAQQVASHAKEMATRCALGAEPGRIRRFVMFQGIRPVIQGVTVGLVLAAAARGILRAVLGVQISLLDPIPTIGLIVGLGLIAALACALPAHRAATMDPVSALRAE
jgi:putative ABC transport system permease protein